MFQCKILWIWIPQSHLHITCTHVLFISAFTVMRNYTSLSYYCRLFTSVYVEEFVDAFERLIHKGINWMQHSQLHYACKPEETVLLHLCVVSRLSSMWNNQDFRTKWRHLSAISVKEMIFPEPIMVHLFNVQLCLNLTFCCLFLFLQQETVWTTIFLRDVLKTTKTRRMTAGMMNAHYVLLVRFDCSKQAWKGPRATETQKWKRDDEDNNSCLFHWFLCQQEPTPLKEIQSWNTLLLKSLSKVLCCTF